MDWLFIYVSLPLISDQNVMHVLSFSPSSLGYVSQCLDSSPIWFHRSVIHACRHRIETADERINLPSVEVKLVWIILAVDTLRRPQPPSEICHHKVTPDAFTGTGRGGHRNLVEVARVRAKMQEWRQGCKLSLINKLSWSVGHWQVKDHLLRTRDLSKTHLCYLSCNVNWQQFFSLQIFFGHVILAMSSF
jgi:hypothetical protein